MVKTAPRINKSTADFLPDYFVSINAGCEYVLNSWPGLFKRALDEMKGRFTEGELSVMLDVMDGTIIIAGNYGRHLIGNCQDGIALDGLNKKWKIDKKVFLEKLEALSTFEAACLEVWSNGFWYSKNNWQTKVNDIEKYIKMLL